MELEGEILERVKYVNEESRCLHEWWFGFTSNILKQGWISDKQWHKLSSYETSKILAICYGCSPSKKKGSYDWTSGLDHDDMSDFTGDPSAMDFYS